MNIKYLLKNHDPAPRRKTLDKEQLRDKAITVKATTRQKEEIRKAAGKCGMTPSSFLLARGCGYNPKACLTDEEKALLRPLRDARIDITNFTNALNAMDDEERKQMFRRNSFMVKWLQEIGEVFSKLDRYLKAVSGRNRLPPRTRKEATGQ